MLRVVIESMLAQLNAKLPEEKKLMLFPIRKAQAAESIAYLFENGEDTANAIRTYIRSEHGLPR